jgi:hypothetical protein
VKKYISGKFKKIKKYNKLKKIYLIWASKYIFLIKSITYLNNVTRNIIKILKIRIFMLWVESIIDCFSEVMFRGWIFYNIVYRYNYIVSCTCAPSNRKLCFYMNCCFLTLIFSFHSGFWLLVKIENVQCKTENDWMSLFKNKLNQH